GVTLTGLAMTPATSTLRSLGATEQFAVRGTFSDGSVRDLSAAATGTEYTSSDPSVLAISADGLATSHGAGVVTVSARNDTGLATAGVTVSIASGEGLLRGVVLDDSRGLPLPGASVMLLADGGGDVTPPRVAITDDAGQYVLPGTAGDASVRIE